ncbi:RNA-directed DNA polymerase, eukaryota [Tanacetum coccineum]
MPVQRSNEDQAVPFSKSIFVTNFPDNLGSKELWKVCEGYGKVIDVFIPNRRSKAGKRFAFVSGHVCYSAARELSTIDWPSVAHVSSSPALVLDDSCVVERDLSCHVMGRVKDINSIPNLRILLAKEGFEHVKPVILGGFNGD